MIFVPKIGLPDFFCSAELGSDSSGHYRLEHPAVLAWSQPGQALG
jgi:hypothetical protein